MRMIKHREIVEDSFVHLTPDAPPPEHGDIIVSTEQFAAHKNALLRRSGRLGIKLRSDQGPEIIANELQHFDVIAIDFPKFTDGRGYSTARLLRQRYGYKGELRAVGNVLRDQLFYMHRCGIDAFELQSGKDLESALAAFQEFSVTYQAAADDPRPLYRRRAGAANP